MILRIIDLDGSFLRDDFTFDVEAEIALDVEPAQGFYHPKWDFDKEKWIEGGEKPDSRPRQLTEEERLDTLENAILLLMME